MNYRSKMLPGVLALATAAVFGVGGCHQVTELSDAGPVAADFANQLSAQVTTEAMMGHLQKLQDIADDNDGTRAVGTPGYDASVDYVVKVLEENGFEVQTPEFDAKVFDAEPGELTAGTTKMEVRALEFSKAADGDGVTGPLVVAKPGDDTPGCTPEDYDGLPVDGAVVLVDRGSCPFSEKEAAAAARGAKALIVADNVDEEKMGGTLGPDADVKLPVVSITKAQGAKLREHHGDATVKLKAETKNIHSRNVIAQTETGSIENVVMVGAHLDSVPEGPGINDNGSGVAAALETAVQLGDNPEVNNAVRFAFWGAEELGLIGSTKYVESLSYDELKDIALYLNFDMLASPNAAYLTYDGDQSLPLDKRGRPIVPEGSPGIERLLVDYLEQEGKSADDATFDGRSDYDAFTKAGIPSGGLFSGAEGEMTVEQAEMWGGKAGKPYDPNYHKEGDTIDNINKQALGILGGGVGYAVGYYSQNVSGRNGVAEFADRVRHLQSTP
ncbi:M20/M25/M40 family metallo-hydrolase [Mycobacterium koreense]|uniref:Amidohydrolase n=1 Tax=Mycolicibacillus koreensis TaxID=1069220 RepID=A0AA91PB04_9MYCO|nr:M28 family metallopeptidase [Mycolicibacillus koreensis]MCV7248431.1 M20/M25/M40 family metallo-hydrolase [Mycolicibacillus koreensis]OSC24893.1 amidohydrolase [Mycolicibacillus koreensis]